MRPHFFNIRLLGADVVVAQPNHMVNLLQEW